MLIKNIFERYIYPTAILSGSIIGVGIFSLPYIASQAGIWLMLFYLVVLSAIVAAINSIVGQIALKTPDFKRLPGFAGFHLGKWAEALSLATAALGGFGILLVYLIVGGDFLLNALSPIFGGNYLTYALIYFFAALIFIYFDIKAIAKVELLALISLVFILILIFIKGFSNWSLENIFAGNSALDIKNIFLPYGAIMFSLWGIGMIPEAEEMVRDDKKDIKKIIVISVLIPAVIYFLFVLLVLGITGSQTTDSALTGLKNVLGGWIFSFCLFVGAVITFNGFLSLAIILKKVFMYDIGIKKSHSIIIVCCLPLILFLLGLRSFVPIISFIGGVFIGIEGILILLMYKKIKGKNIIIYPLSLVFILGIIYQLIYFIR
ncbi:MAG: hypothetical protein A2402_02090 [Candidatus Staskawiczbacteria bacterium RIFOXYC1_FULL_37_43]|nr:MAG: hypothetical protein A2813_02180 [Candidatus Staskawiczbacteria bacterium RIFCSPHIGHO2_01_FULL_37_17]OGZ71264.1 MAG: hypothetical protein A2891_03305 [Candidatus Staskawiczbacteria bacterium RIFCSPLOWO2_01_FULL_37_19]OGZ75596.1 MAG: hypothetical protein A2205_00170 [Candidatus Staskawiczbacteria bacterium RIFOXYA1_FULL_37_15]OGZ79872.1 MAG: hypothetical protein A2353_01410 [Candidatus Staskawiczbacteria bacterium RIFOXYB1_FULL_38_37]OGZ81457.1 MAG: hypothetical protein A2402_02090 [Cand